MQTARIITAFSLLLSLAVLVNSMHSKELIASQGGVARVQDHTQDGSDNVKIHSELHDHVDKTGKLLHDNPQTDTRSLRLNSHRRSKSLAQLQDMFNSWRDRLVLYLG
jgi:hypothetical protein